MELSFSEANNSMSAPSLDLKEIREAIAAIRDGHAIEASGYGLVGVRNPRFQPDDGSAPYLVIDLPALVDRITELEDEVAILRSNLERTTCPLPLAGDDGTIEGCIAKGHCGCHHDGRSRLARARELIEGLLHDDPALVAGAARAFLSNQKEVGE